MPREEPYFRKCCYCIPLKSCLETWSIVKWVVDISLAGAFAIAVVIIQWFHPELQWTKFTLSHMFIITSVVLVIDSVFMLILFVGLCTNNLGLLRAIYYYSIFMVFLETACLIGFLILTMINMTSMIVVFVLFGLINAALDTCIIFTLKSEIIKLRNKQQYQFQQMPTLVNRQEHGKLKEPFQADAENDMLSQTSEL